MNKEEQAIPIKEIAIQRICWHIFNRRQDKPINDCAKDIIESLENEFGYRLPDKPSREAVKNEVVLEPENTPMGQFQKERTDAISEMFNNVDENGIYPTSRFFARLDNCVRNLLALERTQEEQI